MIESPNYPEGALIDLRRKQMNMKRLMEECSKATFIVVEGFDGVGKGKVIDQISESLKLPVYRPDYKFWQEHKLPREYRWCINAAYFDILNATGAMPDKHFIFDRGMLSGSVYNNDESLARDYAKLIRYDNVFHILVSCSEESFKKYAEIRGKESGTYHDLRNYSETFLRFMEKYEMKYGVYLNEYEKEYAQIAESSCIGCGHYSHGICSHPYFEGKYVGRDDQRCLLSLDKEVQDESL